MQNPGLDCYEKTQKNISKKPKNVIKIMSGQERKRIHQGLGQEIIITHEKNRYFRGK